MIHEFLLLNDATQDFKILIFVYLWFMFNHLISVVRPGFPKDQHCAIKPNCHLVDAHTHT